MKHLKSFPVFEYKNQWELNQILNDAFTSPEWQEKFRCIGRYPIKFFQNDEHFKIKAENDNSIVFNPWRSDTQSQRKLEDRAAPFFVAYGIARDRKYRNDKFKDSISCITPYVSMLLTQQESGRNTDIAEPRQDGSFNPEIEIRIKGYPSIEWVEETMMNKFLSVLNVIATGEIYGDLRMSAQMLIDILTGKINYEESIQRASQIIEKVLPSDTEILMDELDQIPSVYAKKVIKLRGYSNDEYKAISDIKDIGIF
jgi:hypothetical protein